ncbi:DUF4157 domain-containing protein [Actinosynnema sp. NPDC047251]|uniref:eCIS core domain-containing protein n=1 Tax=Saccharothrix espanaensis (strain ATCC 51144 / DSM 44229 / JCM 9112 / NBRC 15066 / NRRL 15764) TaxID=1179773 RepID=K0K269_SACES|nr:DUF4157 domain-containing protein [Saccharothrix espanaensis]CCH30623.1 hypothetical protein BN6_33190 [Saccharothrix espanaensis DSM 44229]
MVIGSGGADRHTLAHELTHVIQQGQGPVAGTDRGDGTSISDPSDRFERAAEANATRVMDSPTPQPGTSASESASGGVAADVQRAPAATGDGDLTVQRMGNCFSNEPDQDVPLPTRRPDGRSGGRPGGQSSGGRSGRSGRRSGGQSGSSALAAPVPVPLPAAQLGDILRRFGIPLRELEFRMFDPHGVLLSFIDDEEMMGLPLNQAYTWLTQNFTSVCGETVNILRETSYPDSGAPQRIYGLDQVLGRVSEAGDANLEIHTNGHTFFVERRGPECRILQSYIGSYSLADSLAGASHAGTTTIQTADLVRHLRDIAQHHMTDKQRTQPFRAHPDENRLFGGPLFNEQDLRGDEINIWCTATSAIRPANDQEASVTTRLNQNAAVWDEIRDSSVITSAWLFPS